MGGFGVEYMYIYDKKYGNIIGKTLGSQHLDGYYHHLPELLQFHSSTYSNKNIENYRSYKVIEGNIVKMSVLEIEELRLFGRVLSPDERLIESLKPSIQEIQKAESEIEILTLLNEVDVI